MENYNILFTLLASLTSTCAFAAEAQVDDLSHLAIAGEKQDNSLAKRPRTEQPTHFFVYSSPQGFDPAQHKDHSKPTPQEVAVLFSQLIPCRIDKTVCTLSDPELSRLRFDAPATKPLMSFNAFALLDEAIRSRVKILDFEGAHVGKTLTNAGVSFGNLERIVLPDNVIVVNSNDGCLSFGGQTSGRHLTLDSKGCIGLTFPKKDSTETTMTVGKKPTVGDILILANKVSLEVLPDLSLKRIQTIHKDPSVRKPSKLSQCFTMKG